MKGTSLREDTKDVSQLWSVWIWLSSACSPLLLLLCSAWSARRRRRQLCYWRDAN